MIQLARSGAANGAGKPGVEKWPRRADRNCVDATPTPPLPPTPTPVASGGHHEDGADDE